VGRSSIPSSSVPSPYVRARFGLRKSFGGGGGATLGGETLRDLVALKDERRTGEFERGALVDEAKTEDNAGRDFCREIISGMVRRKAMGLDEGVDGRVGGTMTSLRDNRLSEPVCDLAREAAVGVS
jgi:hypothetical protein